MDVSVVVGRADTGDQLRSLREWLTGDQMLRGRVDGRESPPEPGTMGPTLDALVVAVAPGGAATAFATGVIAWLCRRRGEVEIKVTVPDGRSLELTAKRVADLDPVALRQLVADLAGLVGQGGDEAEQRELP
ncbi:hypothetical protein AB0L06_28045 [Spirillospora sp. NPDC052269]